MSQIKTEDQYNLFDWYKKCLSNYANFDGRARRKEFWYFTLVYTLIVFLTIIIDVVLKTRGIVTGIFILAMIVPSISVAVRRLHDTGRSGWFYLIQMVPVVGPILVLIWFATETNKDTNQWGNPAK